MNERLKQLAMQCNAWEQVYNPHKFMVDRTFDIEKFADLIVEECAEVCLQWNHDVPYTDEQCAAAIKEHFGVKE